MKSYLLLLSLLLIGATTNAQVKTWTADNGNGTYTNPLFYDEFSDPDCIRVGEDYYLAGTTMHCAPGLVVLHSKDLVNWELASYCFNRWSDILPDDKFKLINDSQVYGQGVWAPVIRYHEGKFYVFTNVNGNGLQLFISDSAYGPWEHRALGGHIYDLSVLFDEGHVYAIHGYDEVKVTEFKPDFSGYIEGSERVIIPKGSGMGEGHHAYKIDGKYYILSSEYAPMGRMQCARSESIFGPYETTAISVMESLGTQKFPLITNANDPKNKWMDDDYKFTVATGGDNELGNATIHQGGMLMTPNGEWYGLTMLDFVGVGRTTCLCPITWQDGWPIYGLKGNPGRTPRTWVKPNVGAEETTTAMHGPYERSDNFNGKTLNKVWQWNHEPIDKMWSLKKGKLVLRAMGAQNFLHAHNTLTQRCIGPVSIATVTLSPKKLREGDVAGLAILNLPYAWIGVRRYNKQLRLQWMQQEDGMIDVGTLYEIDPKAFKQGKVYLRIYGDFDEMWAKFSYSTDGVNYHEVGEVLPLPYQLKIFQGSRYSLFCYHTIAQGNNMRPSGGFAEFDDFVVEEPMADRSANFPMGKVITLTNLSNGTRFWGMNRGICHSAAPDSKQFDSNDCKFRVHDRGQGRVVLECLNGMGYVTVTGFGLSADVRLVKEESEASLFQWQDMLRGQCMLMSLKTHRYVGCTPDQGEPYSADFPGSSPNRKNGCVFQFEVVE